MRATSTVLLLAALLGAHATASATPISASMALTARIGFGTTTISDPKTASWGKLLDPLSVSSMAEGNRGCTEGPDLLGLAPAGIAFARRRRPKGDETA